MTRIGSIIRICRNKFGPYSADIDADEYVVTGMKLYPKFVTARKLRSLKKGGKIVRSWITVRL